MDTAARIDAFLLARNIIIDSMFKPMTGTPKRAERKYCYTVNVRLNGRDVITTEYSMGVGHGEFYKKHAKDSRLGDYDKTELQLVTAGKAMYALAGSPWKWYKAPTPAPRDVFMALVSDATCGDMPFEDFCAEFGYSTTDESGAIFFRHDARNIYDACTNTRYKLLAALGRDGFAAAVELSQDY